MRGELCTGNDDEHSKVKLGKLNFMTFKFDSDFAGHVIMKSYIKRRPQKVK